MMPVTTRYITCETASTTCSRELGTGGDPLVIAITGVGEPNPEDDREEDHR